MSLIFNSDGGDLGLPNIYTNQDHLRVALDVASAIFKGIDDNKLTDKNLKFGIGLALDVNVLEVEHLLSRYPNMYSIYGKRLFEMRAPGGGYTSNYICYVTNKGLK